MSKQGFVPEFTRTLGVLRFRFGNPASRFLNEICLLEALGISDDALQRLLGCVDCNRFNPSEELDEELAIAARDPKLGDMNKLCNLVNSGHPITVHKRGATTGQTTGSLFEIQKYGDLPTYRLLVEWSSPDVPFAVACRWRLRKPSVRQR